MKILIIDSSRNNNSRNRKFSNYLINKLEINYNIKYINPNNVNLLPCLGCCKCFYTGSCSLDLNINDSGQQIKKLLKWSDLIIFNSPVYAHSVSSDMKTLIDRLSYWLHIFELKGRGAIILTTTETNGAEYHNSYLNKIITGWGLVRYYESTFYKMIDNHYEEELLNRIIKKINEFNISELHSSKEHEAMFSYFKYVYLNTDDSVNEKQIWKERGYFDKHSFQELLNEGKSVY